VNREDGGVHGIICYIFYKNLLSSFVVSLSELYCTRLALLPVHLGLKRTLIETFGTQLGY
jgi:hypothetical protein